MENVGSQSRGDLSVRCDLLERELTRVRTRLEGVLSIMASVSLGESSFGAFANTVCDELQATFQADAAVLYFVEDYGFRVTGRSQGFSALQVRQEFVPTGVGLPTLVMRNRRAVRVGLVDRIDDGEGAVVLDVASGMRTKLRSEMAKVCSTLMGAPVFSYDRVVAVVMIGWRSAMAVPEDDERLLTTVADYLSVELAAMVTQMEQARATACARSHNEINALMRNKSEMTPDLLDKVVRLVLSATSCNAVVLEQPVGAERAVARLGWPAEPSEVLDLPYSLDDVFGAGSRFVRIDESSACGLWVARHTDLAQGYGIRFARDHASPKSAEYAALFMRGPHEVPFDQVERDFFRRVARDAESSLKEGRRHENEAKISKALQMGLRNVLPQAKGLTSSSLYISATASALVGGDFFDLYEINEGHVVVVIGDVSGKGVEAAAMASLVKTSLAAYAWDDLDPAHMLSSLNNLFLNFSRLETFASMVVVKLDLASRTAQYCSGGHPPAMLVHRPFSTSRELELLTEQSPIVGAFEDMEYENGAFTFEPGDLLYLYTDGTTEARSPDGAFFGEDNLRIALLGVASRDVDDIPRAILETVSSFAGGDLHDDIGMVALRFE